jgi:DNA-directed RNA polymerase specialized sigma24 family protein
MFHLAPREPTLEDLFLERYDRLLDRARHLTQGSLQQAQDLVHDLFVELTLGQPDIAAIRNLDAYLHAILRNLYVSELRRGLRFPTRPLSVVDYDSVAVALRHVDPLGCLETAEELCNVCTWACARKAASKTGSVLILRFFYGYSPRETSDIMRTRAGTVDEWLRRARREARLALRSPAFRGAAALKAPQPILPRLIAESDEPLTELRREIARWCTDDCLDYRILAARYASSSSDSIDGALLAHIVSCPDCLAYVARSLGLRDPWDEPPADGRGPESSDRRTRRTRRPDGERQAVRREAITAAQESAGELFDCRPTELYLAVNGLVVASQTTGSDESRLTIQLGAGDRVEFVEVLADDHRRLLLLPIDSLPQGALEQHAIRSFSDGRSLSAAVSFAGPAPTVSVTYEPGIEELREFSFASVSTGSRSSEPAIADGPAGRFWRWLYGPSPRSPFATFARGAVTALLVLWLILGGGEAIASAAARAGVAVWRWVVGVQQSLQPSSLRPARSRSIAPADIHLPATTSSAAGATTVRAAPRRTFSEAELFDIEVGALQALDDVDALLAEDVQLTRDAASGVHVSIVSNGMGRAAALRRALRPMLSVAGLHLSIVAPRDPATEALRELTYREFQVQRDQTPAWTDLQQHFAQLGGLRERAAAGSVTLNSWVDSEAREYARRVVATSQNAVQHTWAMKRLLDRFESDNLQRINATAHARWRELIARHARSYGQEMARLQADLSIVFATPRHQVPETVRPADERDIEWRLAVQRLIELGGAINASVQRSFTSSPDLQIEDEAAVKTSAFWEMVGEADRLSSQIRHQSR